MPVNRLIHETSPYLLQHAHNPVDWLPWSEEALAHAREEGKPVLLSIGYSACHWCHVMEHESFSDEAIARYMNAHYVCVKVDREERPDIDKIYQTAYQLLNQRPGGWPLTVFMSAQDQVPFYIGTYFPDEPRHGMPAFGDVLQRVHQYFRDNTDELAAHGKALTDALQRMQGPRGATDVGASQIARAAEELERQFDAAHGGFGSAPKFPHPGNLELCLRQWRPSAEAQENPRLLHMAQHTLEGMARGGIYDHLQGGFCRYAVDERWEIPHFEKMLYDNAQLLPLYADAWAVTGTAEFRAAAEETAHWVMQDMQSPTGGYFSSRDADSEGEEGRFYVWTREEITSLLDDNEFNAVAWRYGLNDPPNFDDHWHLTAKSSINEVALKTGTEATHVQDLIARSKQKLAARRSARTPPQRDEKILTSWNALMIKGMAHAGRVLDNDALIESSERALDFLARHVWCDGRLRATSRDHKSHLNAYLDDYVFLIDAILELLQCRWRSDDLRFAVDLAEVVLDQFEDRDHGGMYFTSHDHEELLYRQKPTHDEALPSGNGVAAWALQKLGHLVGEPRYLDSARRILQALAPAIVDQPAAHATLLMATDEYHNPSQIVVLRGELTAMLPWQRACLHGYTPRRLAFAIPQEEHSLPGILSSRIHRKEVTAYLCEGFTCKPPVTDFSEFERMINPGPREKTSTDEQVLS